MLTYSPFQVFYLLHPVDILRIARTTKAFRSLLMVRGSDPGSVSSICTSIWKEARKNVEGFEVPFPGPFPDMSEPAFASLCFEFHCTVSSTISNEV